MYVGFWTRFAESWNLEIAPVKETEYAKTRCDIWFVKMPRRGYGFCFLKFLASVKFIIILHTIIL